MRDVRRRNSLRLWAQLGIEAYTKSILFPWVLEIVTIPGRPNSVTFFGNVGASLSAGTAR